MLLSLVIISIVTASFIPMCFISSYHLLQYMSNQSRSFANFNSVPLAGVSLELDASIYGPHKTFRAELGGLFQLIIAHYVFHKVYQ